MNIENKGSVPYQALCSEYYDLDKPDAPEDAFQCYLRYVQAAKGPILEPMCGTGRFLIPFLERRYAITGFDSSRHMLEICRRKFKERHLAGVLVEASFETFSLPETYDLIFIPSGSFCLLTTSEQVNKALAFVSSRLRSGGKFVFEVETLKAVNDSQGVWKGNWVCRPDGSKIVLSTLSRFDEISRIETTLCRYELWRRNSIYFSEVEDFRLRLYDPSEIEELIKQHGLKIIGKRQAEPYVDTAPSDKGPVILYECIKGNTCG